MKKYIECLNYIKDSCQIYDLHVHPFDVVNGLNCYKKSINIPGLYSSTDSEYVKEIVNIDNNKLYENVKNKELRDKVMILSMKRLYSHTGPKVILNHMENSGVKKSLLLPVLKKEEHDNEQMSLLKEMFGSYESFCLGYCLPNNVENLDIHKTIKNAKTKYNVVALKIHPNITEIDISSVKGIEKILYTLDACNKEQINIVMHGGKSSYLGKKECSKYATIENIGAIDWSVTKTKVIIAHCGAFDCDEYEVKNSVIPRLKKLFSKYDNLLIDTSNINRDILYTILKSIGCDRAIFGSDSFYEKQYYSILKLLYVLNKISPDYESLFVKIACKNTLIS